MEPADIYQWVSDHNPSPKLSYGKGWWDYVTFLYHLDELYGKSRTTVVSTYERSHHRRRRFCSCRLPAGDGTGPHYHEDTVQWHRSGLDGERHPGSSRPGAAYGLIDEHEELAAGEIAGFVAQWVFPCYAKSPARFTGRVEDDWQLYVIIWVLAHS